jgi:hypothetical protein
MKTSGYDPFIVFIQLEDKLPLEYFQLAIQLRQFDLQLIPIKAEELDQFLSGTPPITVVITKTMGGFKRFLGLKKDLLNFTLKNGRVRIFHVNSFSRIRDWDQYEPRSWFRNISLPLTIPSIAAQLLSFYLEHKKSTPDIWPGKNRAKLFEPGN